MNRNENKNTVERELRRFSSIVEKHAQKLENIIETIEPYSLPAWQPNKDPITLNLKTFEQISDQDLIRTDNQLLNKTVMALTSVSREMSLLADEAEKDFYIPLCLYGEKSTSVSKSKKTIPQECFSKLLPVLDQINSYIQFVKKVSWNVLLQMNALHSNERKYTDIHAGTAHFQVVLEHLGRLLGTLIVLDEIILNNPFIHNHLSSYKTLLRTSKTNPSSVGAERKELLNLENFILDLEAKVLNGSIFKSVLNELSEKGSTTIVKNNCLREELLTVILGWSSQVEDVTTDGWWCEYEEQILSITALSIFYQIVFDTQEKKIAKELILLYRKVPCVTVAVNHVWMGDKYISSTFPTLSSLFERKALDSLAMHRKNYLSNKTHSIASEVQSVSLKVIGWSAQMEAASKRAASQMTKQDLSRRAYLLWQGLIIASSLKYTAESILGLHTAIGQPMSRTCVSSFCHILELLKAIEYTYHYNTSMLAETLPHLRQYISFQILTLLKNTKARASTERKLSIHHTDVLSALSLAEQALSGNGTLNRRLIGRLSLSFVNQEKIISDEDLSSLLLLLRRFGLVSDLQENVRKCTNTEFLYHHKVIFQIYLQNYFETFSSCLHKIHYMLAAVANSESLLMRPKFLPNRDQLISSLHEDMENSLKQEFLDKICKAVETELRLSTHTHLHLDDRNPFVQPLQQVYPLIHLQPLNCFGHLFSVKDYLEQYLERIFYNLTVVAPHDCGTYDMMRNFAQTNLGLCTVPSHLPSHTLEQGVDVLEIMRNINVFVQHYQYNLNQQFFIEVDSNNKHLNTVSIKHIANSIRTHGAGIINTTVNFTYQFLRRKFHILSQFLYDEHIKSRLLKNLQYWKEVKASEKSFPYQRAEKFHRGIRKLGLSGDGLSYLDQFRKLVTHIGNAIGYVRLVRSGGLHCISAATQFIPDLQDMVSFGEICQKDCVTSNTMTAAENLDAVITNLTGHFHQETDYFKIMVDVFSSVLQDSKNSHLKNFFLIVPALTINFIEYFVAVKGKLLKKNRSGASFTDDGFAMGIAYILKVLEQNTAFDSLHWWSGVRRKFIKEKEKVERECENVKDGDKKLHQTLSLTLSRFLEHEKEFDMLFLSVSSACVFFKSTTEEKEEDIQSSNEAKIGEVSP